ncbi:MAG: oxidoreductase, partial [Burkholderiales bacterium 21-58-4]
MSAWTGGLDADTTGSEYNSLDFFVRQIVESANHCALVKVITSTNTGSVAAVGFVDIMPLVFQIDGAGKTYPHGVVRKLPVFRLQGGGNAVILDPVAGDIGIAVFADRDSSAAIAAKGIAPPGSRRRSDWADGFYIGGFSNVVPTQYVQFSSAGITLVSPTTVKIQAPTINLAGNVTSSG